MDSNGGDDTSCAETRGKGGGGAGGAIHLMGLTVDTAMDNLAKEQDKVLKRLERAGVGGDCGPKLNDERGDAYWLNQPGSPKAKLADEKPKPVTIAYDKLIETWQ